MLQKVFSVLLVFGFFLLAACNSLPPAGTSTTGDLSAEGASTADSALSADEPRLVLESLAFAQRVASASLDEQRQEVSAAAKAFARQRSSASRLRYGLLLALPALAGADAQRALVTLEPLSTSGPVGPLRQFVTLLTLQINERLKEQRRAQQFREQLDESRASERSLNERATQLKTQLDELRVIERTLIERGRPKK
jgi:hypothetical protein